MVRVERTRGTGGGGFTLVELLVVVAIIAVLMSLLLPGLAKAKDQAKSAVCLSNLRQVGMGFHMYLAENGLILPATIQGGKPNNAHDAIQAELPKLPDLWPAGVKDFRMCPVAFDAYKPMYVNGGYVQYAWNQWWSDVGEAGGSEPAFYNAGRSAALIRTPTTYVYFVDAASYLWVPANGWWSNAPWVPVTWFSLPSQQGVGPLHRGGTAFNGAFADGHGETVLVKVVETSGTSWFQNN